MAQTVEEFVKTGRKIARLNNWKGHTKTVTQLNSFIAKPIINDKFWIMEQLGKRIGTLQKDRERFVFLKNHKEYFESYDKLMSKYAIQFIEQEVEKTPDIADIYGYPFKGKSFNSVLDIKHGLPLYTKTEKSKSFFCAGYYIIKFKKLWSPNFCPKLITLSRYEYEGPFKTKLEQRDALKNVNKGNK